MKARTVTLLLASVGWLALASAAGFAQGGGADEDLDGVSDDLDRCPSEPETPNGHADKDGCPDSLESLIDLSREVIDEFWRGQFSDAAKDYEPPRGFVTYTAESDTPCGPTVPGNAFYCRDSHSLYFDRDLLDREFQRGDFGPVVVIAHEWGHMVQDELGILADGRFSIQTELQADCLAGAFAHYADSLHMLEPGDLEEGVTGLFRGGDNDVRWFDPQAHGRPGQRIDSFWSGYKGSVDACTDSSMVGIVGIQEKSIPTGSLRDRLPGQNGRFGLVHAQAFPEALASGATDGLMSTYQAEDGAAVTLLLMAFPSPEDGEDMLDTVAESLAGRGFSKDSEGDVTDDAGVRLGRVVVLEGDHEIVLWTSGNLLASAEAVEGVAWEFAETYPD